MTSTNEKIILGIDPGTTIMGFGLIKIVKNKMILIQMNELVLNKLDDHYLRLKHIFERTIDLIEKYNPDEISIEAPFFGKNVQSMLKLGRAQGVAMAAGLSKEIPITEYSPKKIKMSITGNGNASKEQVAKMLQSLLNIKELPKNLDSTDGLAAAVCHFYNSNKPKFSSKKYSGWTAFVKNNNERIKKIILSGIYLHIPFCKQACHYCNFHFSTSKKNKDVVIESMIKELEAKSKDNSDIIETIYFGGGTPSILNISEINKFIKIIYKNFKISENIEITLEANPEDLSLDKVKELSLSSVNRLSIGIQSFNDTELKMMNRSHNSNQSKNCIENASRYFDNLSIDLIYGMPNSNLKSWAKNLQMLESWEINHISAYALTVESNTALKKFIEKEIIVALDDQEVYDQYNFMFEKLSLSNYINYELSSFAKEGYFSKKQFILLAWKKIYWYWSVCS